MTRRRARYGEGRVTRERGRFRARIPDGHGGEVSLGVYDTEDEAHDAREEGLRQRAELAVGVTLRQYGARWLRRYDGRASARTWDTVWRSVVLRAPFADEPLRLLRPADIQAWLLELPRQPARRSVLRGGRRELVETDRTLSRSVQVHALGLVRRCLEAAAVAGHCEPGLCQGLRVPPADEVPTDPPYLDAEDLQRLLGPGSPLPDEQRAVFTVAVYAGLRQGELAALRWEDVDLERGVLHVRRSWTGPTKNRRRRTVPLIGPAHEALARWKEHVAGQLGTTRTAPVQPRDEGLAPRGNMSVRREAAKGRAGERPAPSLVFPGPGGKLRHRGFDWGWADHPEKHVTRLGWWRRCGVRRQVRFHDLRDTCATHLLSGTWGRRWTVYEVSRLLGHSSVTVTEQRYAHVLPDLLERAAAETPGAPTRHRRGTDARSRPAANPPRVPVDKGVAALEKAARSPVDTDGAGNRIRTGDLQLGKLGLTPEIAGESTARGGFAAGSAGELAIRALELAAAGAPIPDELSRELGHALADAGLEVLRAEAGHERAEATVQAAIRLLPGADGRAGRRVTASRPRRRRRDGGGR
ncbi:MAG: site-specific integrase [Gammaproteobacteria bacterium]|nr:site-specific integrase [Gammaproteobacteria bacterium]NIR85177.1 site-specific integrase [Gammaproteobacteria bacterium]NIU06226.1 site-specific integrase [Gammaproteobacteria bacterium]NIX87499.1 tyrosine-type recombinase/integrase [Gammaproteobacteria bacterium]